MIGHIGLGLNVLKTSLALAASAQVPMSSHQVLASLYGGLVGYDAVSWYAYAVQTGTDGTQTAHCHRALQTGDDASHQWTANHDMAYRGRPEECDAKQ